MEPSHGWQGSSTVNPVNLCLNWITGNHYRVIFQVNIDLGSNPKLWQVNPRFNRKARVRNQVSLILGLQAVHVGAGAVIIFSNVVTRSMDEEIAKASFGDVASSDVVDLPSLNLL